MGKNLGMSRDATPDTKIQAPSIPELKDGFDIAVKRIARSVKFRGRKLRPGPLLNALVLDFLRLSEDAQRDMAARSIVLYEKLLSLDEPLDDLSTLQAVEEGTPIGAELLSPKPKKPRTRRKD